MGHAFECEYCESFHTSTDGCEEYERQRRKKHTERNKMKTRIKKETGYPIRYIVEAKPKGTWITVAICYNYNFARKTAKLYKETYGEK